MTPINFAQTPQVAGKLELEQWLQAVERRTARVGIIGLGYVGLPLTLLFSEERFRVTGFDIDTEKVESLNRGSSYIHRIETDHIRAGQRSGFLATADFTEIANMDAILICVPTPLNPDHTPDMSYVVATIESVAPHRCRPTRRAREHDLPRDDGRDHRRNNQHMAARRVSRCCVDLLPPTGGSADELDGVMVAFSPEREDPGNMITPRRDIPKVIGGVDPRATAAAAALYGSIFTRTVTVSTPAAAEMTQATREHLPRSEHCAGQRAEDLCDAMGIDIWEVIDAAATKPFGFQAFYPGPRRGRTLHPDRPVLSDLEGPAVRLPGEVHRAGRRGERGHAALRGAIDRASAGAQGRCTARSQRACVGRCLQA